MIFFPVAMKTIKNKAEMSIFGVFIWLAFAAVLVAWIVVLLQAVYQRFVLGESVDWFSRIFWPFYILYGVLFAPPRSYVESPYEAERRRRDRALLA